MQKRIYLICPVRNCTEEQKARNDEYVSEQESIGQVVHYPPRDVDQNCPTGISIVAQHAMAMIRCDEVHVIWDAKSSGSHFDLGMAVALRKPILPVDSIHPDGDGKSYWKVMNLMDQHSLGAAFPYSVIEGPEAKIPEKQ